jgi:hypothetical protein
MESGRPDRPEVEVLDTERPPGALQQWVSRMLGRPVVRATVAVVAVLALVGVWITLPGDEPEAAADAEEAAAPDTPPGPRPPPARGRQSPTGSWQVADDLAIRSGPKGHVVTFSAVNGGATAQDPADLEVVAGFVDRAYLQYRATCSGVRLAGRDAPRFRRLVEPGQEVFVRCRDTTRYGGRTAWIDPSSVTVRRTPCESEGDALPL